MGLASRKPPGDPVSPQTGVFPRRPARGRRQSAGRRGVAGARGWSGGWSGAGSGQASAPFPAAGRRLARGGSRHRALRPGCSGCRRNKLPWPPAPSTEARRPPSPSLPSPPVPPPPMPFSAGTRRPAARASSWSTLSRRRSNFDSGCGVRVPVLPGSGGLASRRGWGWGEGRARVSWAQPGSVGLCGNLFAASGERGAGLQLLVRRRRRTSPPSLASPAPGEAGSQGWTWAERPSPGRQPPQGREERGASAGLPAVATFNQQSGVGGNFSRSATGSGQSLSEPGGHAALGWGLAEKCTGRRTRKDRSAGGL